MQGRFACAWAQGLQLLRWCPCEPTVGSSGEPSTGGCGSASAREMACPEGKGRVCSSCVADTAGGGGGIGRLTSIASAGGPAGGGGMLVGHGAALSSICVRAAAAAAISSSHDGTGLHPGLSSGPTSGPGAAQMPLPGQERTSRSLKKPSSEGPRPMGPAWMKVFLTERVAE